MTKQLLLLFLGTLTTMLCVANASPFPAKINPNAFYVFYSHGYIVEGNNPKPVHPRWGVYDFPAVTKALSDENYILIAKHRPSGIKPFDYAKILSQEVTTLLEANVPASHITLVGFSRGGALTILASDILQNNQLNFVVLAGCAGFIKRNPKLKIYGNVLSVYETSDQVGSCDFVIERSPNVTQFNEIAISTGKEHGAFYLPRNEWLIPVKKWIKNRGAE